MGEPYPLSHGDEVLLGATTLLFHIHPGTETCDDCEPGQVRAQAAQQVTQGISS